MRLKRTQNDFRVSEVADEAALLAEEGPFTVYRLTKRGLTTPEAVDLLAKAAGVERDAVAFAGLKDKDGVTSQLVSVRGGKRVSLREPLLAVRPVGRSARPVESGDSAGNSFEITLRDLIGDDMRRVRVHLEEVRRCGLPNYFDDQRFGCLRHGQGFVVRDLLRGRPENALRALLAAPSPYGAEPVERYKSGIAERWGDWEELLSFARGRRGASAFEHLRAHPEDFVGALQRGVSTRERTMHLFAYQSYLWNRAAAHWVRAQAGEAIGWLPGDAGALPVHRTLEAEALEALRAARLPLLGPEIEPDGEAARHYDPVLRSEGITREDFAGLDLPGFRPQAEWRPLLLQPQHLRAAPAERDEIYRKRHKMRLRFTLLRGQYATLVCKRLVMPDTADGPQLRLWISRHPLEWPDAEGRMPLGDPRDRRHWQDRRRDGRSGGGPRRDGDRRGGPRGGPHGGKPGGKPGGKYGGGKGGPRGGHGGPRGKQGGSKGGPRSGGGPRRQGGRAR